MANRDPFGRGAEARRMLSQPPRQEGSSAPSWWRSPAEERKDSEEAVRRLRGDISTYYRTLRAQRIAPYIFKGKAPRGNLKSSADAYNPISKQRKSQLLAGGVSSVYAKWHDIRFRGWPIGDISIVPISGEDSYAVRRGLILLDAGKVALSYGGIFGKYDGGENDPLLPPRGGDIDVGRLYEQGFPVSLGSLAAKNFREAFRHEVSEYGAGGAPTNTDHLRLTMTMVLEKG